MTAFEPDFDSFLNVDNDFAPTSATATPDQSVPTLSHHNSSSSNFGGSSQQQTFSGPSFPYDAYRQQTGLPVGGLANTFAINQTSGLNHFDGHNSFVMPNEINNFPLTKIEDFDFARHPSFDMTDMDFEDDSPTDAAMFYPGGSSKGFVSPTNLIASGASSSTAAPIQRMYPGMHSQQAAQKAQQAQQKQQELIRQQQQQQQSQRQIPGQKPLPKGPAAKDPAVEESISRILSQMRQKSVTENGDDEDTPGPSISSMPRTKKEEDDMDEDELLLASEEGKKLTSKERRQLRNKVSARAFRSRRKEYIGQLEGDIAVKNDEAAALRTENQQLREENTRLTDLTRMLLSSPAFAGFLQDLSQTGQAPSHQPALQQTRQERTQAQPTRKDVNPHEAARQIQQSQQQQQVGMVLMPETNVDMSLFDNPSWPSTLPSNDLHIYSVTSLPEGPALDTEKMSGKTNASKLSKKDTPKMLPSLPEVPEAVQEACTKPDALEDAVVDTATAVSSRDAMPVRPAAIMTSRKVSLIPTMARETSRLGSGSWDDLKAMCNELEETSKRLRDLMPDIK